MSELLPVLTLHVGNRNCSRWYDLRAQCNGIVCVFEKQQILLVPDAGLC